MKKAKILSLLLAAGLLVGCANNPFNNKSNADGDNSNTSAPSGNTSEPIDDAPEGHNHEWSSEWSYNLTHHWHACEATISDDDNPAACPSQNAKAEHEWDAGRVTKEPGAYQEGEKEYSCTVCGAKKTERIAGLDGGETKGNFTFNENDLNKAQEIHTEDQLKYLALNKPYYEMNGNDLNGFHATGASSLKKVSWAPNKVTVNWEYNAPSGKTVSNYTFIYGQTQDLGDGYQITGLTDETATFANPYLGDNYFKVIANLSDGSKEASDVKIFKVVTQAPRNLDVGNMPNCRDMGGRTTSAGGKVRQGLIYRTSGSKFDNNTPSDTEAKNVLLQQLKVKTEINVANSTTNNVNLTGVKVVDAFMDYGATPYSNLARNAEKIRQVMSVLGDKSNYPVFYHCRIGTDRTGITGVMIGGLIGIPFNEVIQDYGFSNFSPIDNQRYPGKTPDNNGDDIKKYIDEILAMPGANFQEQTYNALLTIGVPAYTLDTIIDIMTEGPKAELGKGVKAGVGDYLSSTGTKGTNSDFSKPAVYHTITSGKAVSYTAKFTGGIKDIVVYLGCTDSSSSKKLAEGIVLLIDDEEQEIVDKDFLHAGFGTTQQNRRTGYMINILGQYDLDQGEHVITIEGISSTSFDVGSICVFDHIDA